MQKVRKHVRPCFTCARRVTWFFFGRGSRWRPGGWRLSRPHLSRRGSDKDKTHSKFAGSARKSGRGGARREKARPTEENACERGGRGRAEQGAMGATVAATACWARQARRGGIIFEYLLLTKYVCVRGMQIFAANLSYWTLAGTSRARWGEAGRGAPGLSGPHSG